MRVPAERLLNVSRETCVIGVNGAIEWLERIDLWCTIDMEKKNRARVAVARPGVKYYAVVPHDFGTPDAAHPGHRPPPEPHVTFLKPGGPKWGKGVRYPLTDDPHYCTLGNSTYGALNLAYLLKPKRIVILGLDGRGGYAHRAGKPGSLYHLHSLFLMARGQLATAGIRLIIGNKASIVKCWPTLDPVDAVDWLEEER